MSTTSRPERVFDVQSSGIEGLATELAGRLSFDTLSMGVLDGARQRIQVFSLHGEEKEPGELRTILPVSSEAFAMAVESGEATLAEGEALASHPGTSGLCDAEVGSLLVLPVMLFGRVVGTLNLGRREKGGYGPAHRDQGVAALEALGDSAAALALHLKIELAEQSARRNHQQIIEFSRVGGLIVQEKDLDRICNLFMQALRENAVFRRGILTLLDDDMKGYKWFFFGMTDEEIEYFHSHSDNKMSREQRAKIFQEKFRVGNSFYIPAGANWEYTGVRSRRPEGEMVDWHPDDFLFIPLFGSHKRLVGVVSVDDPGDGRAPSAETLSSLELFANQVAHAIEEKKLDQEVKKSARKYKTLVETMNDGLVVTDLSERITLINPTLGKLVGYRVEEMIGSSLYTFLTEPSRAQVLAKKDERRLGIKSRYEVELLSKDGQAIPVLMSGAPLYEANRLVGSFAVLSDLREQKKAEAEFHKMHSEIVDTNTRLKESMERLETTQEQLVQAEKLSAIGELVSGVAHELNNPLTGVLGYAQILMTREAPADFEKPLKTIYSEAIRCQKIVQNLLTFARKHKPEKRYVDINEILEATLELRAYQLRVDNIELDCNLQVGLTHTMADYHQMQQVFINLINNAQQAMLDANGKGRLRLSSMVEENRIVVLFQDNGPGLPEDKIGRIFDPFFTTKEVGKGTGLGLSLSYGIVHEHGGLITARNVPDGTGAIFRVELPIRAEEVGRPPATTRRPATAAAGKHILVVDDESAVLELLSDLLSSRGHLVEVAGDGESAVACIRTSQQPFDLVITDMKMPIMDGRRLYEAVREIAPGLAGRMIFTTGDTLGSEARRFLEEGGRRFLSKPFQLEDIERLIGEILAGEGAP